MSNPATESGDLTEAILVTGPPALVESIPHVLPEGHTTLSDPEEIARLRRLLAEKGHAGLRFALAESDLKRRLEDAEVINAALRTQLQIVHSAPDPAVAADQASKPAGDSAEVARLKADWRRAMQSLEREYRESKAELVMVRGQLHQTQRQLEQVYSTRQAEAAKYSANTASIQTDLADALAVTDSHRSQSRDRTTRLLIAAIVFTAVLLTVALTIWTVRTNVSSRQCVAAEAEQIAAPRNNPASAPEEAQPPQAFSLPGVIPAGALVAKQEPRSEPGFAGGMNRLNGALAAFPDRRPEDILREIHRKAASRDPSVCAFEWNNGQPALLYGGAGKLTLAATVDKCADAIEKYHR
jgi:hypothetical protein